MRLTLITHYFPAHGGGVEIVADQIARRLAVQCISIEWFASDCDAPPAAAGVACRGVAGTNCVEQLWGTPYPLPSLKACRLLWRAIRVTDAVHVHECQYVVCIVAAIASRVFGKRLIVTQHVGPIPFRSPLKRLALALLNRMGARLVLRHAHRVFFVSRVVHDYFSGILLDEGRFQHLPNGVDHRRFTPCANPAERTELRIKLGLDPERPLLLFAGRYVEKKGMPLLHKIAAARADWNVLCAGAGPLAPAHWRLPNVRDLGHQSENALVDLYRVADLLVLPSVGEGFPLVVQEAMSCGLMALVDPATAAGVNLPTDMILTESVHGDDATQRWITRIENWLKQPPGVLRASATQMQAHAAVHWSWDNVANIHHRAIEDVRNSRTWIEPCPRAD